MDAHGSSAGADVVATLVRLECNDEANLPRELHVPSSGALIGRKETCSVKLDCPTVSGEQCHIRWNQAGLYFEIEDKSSNGTFLNNRLIGRGKVHRLEEGDVLRLTKRIQTGLVYRFQPAPRALAKPPDPHIALVVSPRLVAAMPSPSVPVGAPGQTAAAASSSARGPAGLDGAIRQDSELLRSLRSSLASENNRLATLATELAAAIARRDLEPAGAAALSKSRKPSQTALAAIAAGVSREGLRAAEEEALQEAERAHLMRQRSVFETELLQRQAEHEVLELSLRRTDEATEREREERARLGEELQCVINGHTEVSGHIEAYQEHLADLNKAHRDLLSGIAPAQLLANGLEAQLQEAHAELDRARAVEVGMIRKAERLEAALSTVTTLAADLANDMRSHANGLSVSLDSSSAVGSDGAAPAAVDRDRERFAPSPVPSTAPAVKENLSLSQEVSQGRRRRSSGSSQAPAAGPGGSPPRRVRSMAAGNAAATGGDAKRRRQAPESLNVPRRPEVDDDPLESASTPGDFKPPGPLVLPPSAPPPGALAAVAAAQRARPRLWSTPYLPSVGAPSRPKAAATTIEDLCSPER